MGFTVEQECPQCGAQIALDETDRLLRCAYCNVKNFLFAPDYFRFVLPNKAPDKEMVYVPYLRFKGNVYSCQGRAVVYRVVDITHLGVTGRGLPVSLGLRPQTMRMKFVTPDTGGSFLKPTVRMNDILKRAGKHSSRAASGEIFHRAYIGEAFSIIYLPLFASKNRIFDAVTNRPISNLPQFEDIFGEAAHKGLKWKLTFVPTLCPECGWDLQGERDSVVLTCSNCETAWEASNGKFDRVCFLVVPGRGENPAYLPFWKLSAKFKGVEINSYADFIRVTNQPRVIQEEWEKVGMGFWSPAFKIRPKIFLDLSRQMTVSQKNLHSEDGIGKRNLYPVTLPRTEAAQAMKLTLASSAINKKDLLPLLPRVSTELTDSTLVYLPFTDNGREMVQPEMRISINKKALEFGRYL